MHNQVSKIGFRIQRQRVHAARVVVDGGGRETTFRVEADDGPAYLGLSLNNDLRTIPGL